MPSLYSLRHRQAEDPLLVGHKAAHLATLLRQGQRVVPGYVVPAPLWRQFLAQIQWQEPLSDELPATALQVDVDDSRQLQATAQRLQAAVEAQPFPQALRSPLADAIAALPGTTLMLRPSLAVDPLAPPPGLLRSPIVSADLDAVVTGMKAVWAQIFQASSLFYWQRKGISLQDIRLAILIQPLMPAIASGTVTVEGTQLILSGVHGLGHALTLGEAVPERYYLDLDLDLDKNTDLKPAQPQAIAGQQTHAYWLDQGPANPETTRIEPSTSAHPAGLLMSSPPALDYRPLPTHAPTVLNPARRQQLIALGRSLMAQSPQVQLEWIICREPDPMGSLYIAQFSPQITPSSPQPPPAHHTPAHHTPAHHTPAYHTPAHTTTSTEVLTGLGAASGQVSGLLYRAETPKDWIPPNTILLAVDVTPDWLPLIHQAVGIVTEQGGMTSHAAILARELGIPTVVGVPEATRRLQTGDRVMLDGDRGSVRRLPSNSASPTVPTDSSALEHRDTLFDLAKSTLSDTERSQPRPDGFSEHEYRIRPMGSFCSLSPSRNGAGTKLMLTLSHVNQLYAVTDVPIDGIGLLRSELLLLPLLEGRHPLGWLAAGNRSQLVARIATSISQLAAAVFPDPVAYRSLNLCSDEFSQLDGAPQLHERNPVLGEHGTHSYRRYPELFETELQALHQVQQAGYSNLRLVLPFVRSVEEVTYAQQLIQTAGLSEVESFQLWIMAEVPSVLLLLPEYVRAGIHGIAIGSNDLTQLLFAADRNQPDLSSRFQAHPAIMKAIKQLVDGANRLGIDSCICGDLPSQHPHTIVSLVEWGMGSISVPPAAAAAARQAIAAAEKNRVS